MSKILQQLAAPTDPQTSMKKNAQGDMLPKNPAAACRSECKDTSQHAKAVWLTSERQCKKTHTTRRCQKILQLPPARKQAG